MKRLCSTIITLTLCLLFPLRGWPEVSEEEAKVKAKIQGFIAQLEAPEPSLHDQAANELVKMGKPAKLALQEALESRPLKTQRRIRELLKKLNWRLAVEDFESAIAVMGGLGLILGVGLALAAKKFAVKIDPKIEAILGVLPGANCAGCGFVGCGSYAEAIARGEAPLNKCAPGGAATAEKLGEMMGMKVEAARPRVARVHCAGCISADRTKFLYSGIRDCAFAVLLADGPMVCKFGCVGMGSCVGACLFGAMHSNPSAPPSVDENKCVGCGLCVAACPKKLIELIPKDRHIFVRCSSHDKGKDVKAVCNMGCITCMLCAKKKCKNGAIEIKDNIPVIDYSKCKECGECAKGCPSKNIMNLAAPRVTEPGKCEEAPPPPPQAQSPA